MRRVNILGNGPGAALFQKGTEGELVVCNMPPIELSKEEVYASCMVDFKMMSALEEGQVNLGEYDWVLGTRPRRWMELKPAFYLKYSQNIRGFHTYVPPYAQLPGNKLSDAATNYSCGHMAVDYACRIMKATEVHMYGFDAMFDMNLESHTDNFLKSDRSEKILNDVRKFIEDTAHDFQSVWEFRPNVLIWCIIFGTLLFWM